MRTTDEIIKEILPSEDSYRYENVEKAMAEWGKEITVDFERWKRLNDRQGGDTVYKMRGLTPEQLFDLYKTENT